MVLVGRRVRGRARMFRLRILVVRVGGVDRVLGWRRALILRVLIRRGQILLCRILRCRVVVLGVGVTCRLGRWVRLVGLCAMRGWRRR